MPLTYLAQGRSGIAWDVISGSLVVARLQKQRMTAGARRLGIEQWDWTFHLIVKPEGFLTRGSARSLDEAKAAVERLWQSWVHAAGLVDPGADQ